MKYGICARIIAVFLCSIAVTGCGSGSSTVSQPTGDFSLIISPQSILLTPGSMQAVSVSLNALNGFDSQVHVSVASIPSEVTPSTTSFILSPGTIQQVSFAASPSATLVQTKITFQAVSGSLSHSPQVVLEVVLPETGTHAPIRTRYLRTDAFYDPNSLQFAPPRFTVYDPLHRRFFVSNPFINVIDVFDAIQEVQIGKLSVPGAWGIDISPDDKTLYAGTLLGDVYQIDPGLMAVTQRIPASTIGPNGFRAIEAFVLADGRLALLGALGGLTVDGSQSFAIWDPVGNSIDVQGAGGTPNSCVGNIGAFAVSGDRTKILFGSVDSDGTLCSFDPITGQTSQGSFRTFLSQILPTPDGKRFFVWGESGLVQVFDTTTVQLLGQIQGPLTNTVPSFPGGLHGGALNRDGTTIYLVDSLSDLFAYDTSSLAQRGWAPNFQVADGQQTIVPGATDETGLIVGPIGHGVAFADGGQIQAGTQSPQIGLGFPAPFTGPVAGDTQIQVDTSSGVQNLNSFPGLGTAFVGNVPLLEASTFTKGPDFFPTIQGTTAPASATGAADFTAVFTNNNVGIMPESFSYGPTIIEVVPNASTADGGTTGALIGYGLGQTASDVHITVGGQPAPVTAFFPGPPIIPYPFPIQGVEFAIPPGAPGTVVDVSVSNANGSSTAAGVFRYTNRVITFPLPNSVLKAGIYDSLRNLYYFTDRNKIQVLSLSNGWQTPITLPNTGASTSLLGLSLSLDGSKLAVANFGDKTIYVLSPDTPAAAQEFALPQTGFDLGTTPTGLAITNAGIVYFATADLDGTGDWAFHKLDSTTGLFTDFSQFLQDGGLKDQFIRVLQSPSGSIYSQIEGIVFRIDPTNDQRIVASAINSGTGGNLELALSADGSILSTNGFLADSSMAPVSMQVYVDRETFIPQATIGQKLNQNGSILFQPLTDGIDMVSVKTGRLLWRVQVPFTLANAYDNLVVNGVDDTVLAITTNGVGVIDLNSLAQLQPLQVPVASTTREISTNHQDSTTETQSNPFGVHQLRQPQLLRKVAAQEDARRAHW
jgi:IPT/TIG domain-containing protein